MATGESKASISQGAWDGFHKILSNKRLLIWLLGTAGGWMLLDFCYYGNTISSPEILKLINPHATILDNTLTQLAIFAVFALPGYAVAILLLDKTGRKSIQVLGFTMMALLFLLIGLIPGVTKDVVPFLLLFGFSYFFTEFGPNTTTFIFPAELFPTDVRTTGHGISAGAGKLGAFAGAFLFPDFLASSIGLTGAMIIAGVVATVGLVLTIVTLPEPRGKSLEELTEYAYAEEPAEGRECAARPGFLVLGSAIAMSTWPGRPTMPSVLPSPALQTRSERDEPRMFVPKLGLRDPEEVNRRVALPSGGAVSP